jgi:hypothetical protein
MNQPEDPTFLTDRLMMGPDGAVHVVPTATRAASPLGETEVRPAPAQQASASGLADLPANVAKPDTGLPGIRRAPGDGGICFSYSAGMPLTDRDAARQALRDIRRTPGQGTSCFSYSAGMPLTDRDAARRALRGIRRAPATYCFSYSAGVPPTDRDAARQALRDIRRAPGQSSPCFSY